LTLEQNRIKRQSGHPPGSIFSGSIFSGSIFSGFPKFDGNGFQYPILGSGVGGAHEIQVPGIGGFPNLQPIGSKPTPDVSENCRTANGQTGNCVQLRQCFPLLFSSSQDEFGYSGLAITLREAAGTCTASNSVPSNPFFYAIGGGKIILIYTQQINSNLIKT